MCLRCDAVSATGEQWVPQVIAYCDDGQHKASPKTPGDMGVIQCQKCPAVQRREKKVTT